MRFKNNQFRIYNRVPYVSEKDMGTYSRVVIISVSGPEDGLGSSVSSFKMHVACMHDQMERYRGIGIGHSSRGTESV